MTVERLDDGRWKVTRERAETGETMIADDLMHAMDVVLLAYRPDGTPRPFERRRPHRRKLENWPQVGEQEGGRTVLCGTEQETKR